MTHAPRPRRGAATYRKEREIRAAIDRGLTYSAIARAAGVTRRVVTYTAERLGLRRPPGRPRATAPSLIPSRSAPPSRW